MGTTVMAEQLRLFENRLSPNFPFSFGLNGKAQRHFVRAVKNFKEVVATQATELTPGARSRHQFNASVARVAIGTGDVGLSHSREAITSSRAVPWFGAAAELYYPQACQNKRLR